jgi:DNA-binding Lrp family transcriptional regulator
VAVPDPVDFRLLSLIAEMGRAAVHDVAARLGMDPREAAARLVALSAAGMPLLVGVECDPNGIRAALAAASRPPQQQWQQGYPQPQYGPPPMQQPQYQQQHPQPQYAPPLQYATPPQSVPFPAQQPPAPAPPAQPAPQQPAPAPQGGTWGPPQTSAWARGDQQTVKAEPVPPRKFTVGSTQQTVGLEGEQLSIQLVEVVDPADFLFTAAGYRLQEGERAVVVHTELTNRGTVPFSSLPDLYLLLVAADGTTVSKAPVSLSSRPPHRIGVQPGETAGGHTVYVLPDSTEITSVRWSPRPDDPQHSLTWEIEN